MKETAVIVNVSRGALIDEDALADALRHAASSPPRHSTCSGTNRSTPATRSGPCRTCSSRRTQPASARTTGRRDRPSPTTCAASTRRAALNVVDKPRILTRATCNVLGARAKARQVHVLLRPCRAVRRARAAERHSSKWTSTHSPRMTHRDAPCRRARDVRPHHRRPAVSRARAAFRSAGHDRPLRAGQVDGNFEQRAVRERARCVSRAVGARASAGRSRRLIVREPSRMDPDRPRRSCAAAASPCRCTRPSPRRRPATSCSDSGARIAVVSTMAQLEKVQAVRHQLTAIEARHPDGEDRPRRRARRCCPSTAVRERGHARMVAEWGVGPRVSRRRPRGRARGPRDDHLHLGHDR